LNQYNNNLSSTPKEEGEELEEETEDEKEIQDNESPSTN
jgi:hypothetical protein